MVNDVIAITVSWTVSGKALQRMITIQDFYYLFSQSVITEKEKQKTSRNIQQFL